MSSFCVAVYSNTLDCDQTHGRSVEGQEHGSRCTLANLLNLNEVGRVVVSKLRVLRGQDTLLVEVEGTLRVFQLDRVNFILLHDVHVILNFYVKGRKSLRFRFVRVDWRAMGLFEGDARGGEHGRKVERGFSNHRSVVWSWNERITIGMVVVEE